MIFKVNQLNRNDKVDAFSLIEVLISLSIFSVLMLLLNWSNLFDRLAKQPNEIANQLQSKIIGGLISQTKVPNAPFIIINAPPPCEDYELTIFAGGIVNETKFSCKQSIYFINKSGQVSYEIAQ
jgi:prepilin-type N-terminal cleavage/methylation domain-containing protein